VVELFAKHNIKVDFSIRGFRNFKKPGFVERVKSKIRRFPKELPSNIDLLKMKLGLSKQMNA